MMAVRNTHTKTLLMTGGKKYTYRNTSHDGGKKTHMQKHSL